MRQYDPQTDNQVLLIDDEEHVLSAFRKVFRDRWPITPLTSALEALKLIETGAQFAVIVSDLLMPGMNGIEFFERVKQLSPDTPKILLSGHADFASAVEAVNRCGLFRFLLKPVGSDSLSLAIEEGLTQYRLIREFQYAQTELQEMNDAKDRFMSILAHDLRNPLHEIIFSSEYLVEKSHLITPERRQSTIEGIQRASRRISDLLENLLTWTRLQRGVVHANPQMVSMHPMIDNEIGLIRPMANHKGVEIIIDIPDSCMVYSDINILASVIRNLVTNAVKFTPKDGAVLLNCEETDQDFRIMVSDNGIGIAPDRLSTILTKPISTPGTSLEKGTGIGLPLCNELMHMNGGQILVDSDPGDGSTFTLVLPKPSV
jgi:signal transduction histidine kinase